MTTNKLRRQLEELKKRRGTNDCPGCGYPAYKDLEVKVVMRRPGEPPIEHPPCEVCGRDPLVIRMEGLPDKSRGDMITRDDKGLRDSDE
jgi:ribosomal protein S14